MAHFSFSGSGASPLAPLAQPLLVWAFGGVVFASGAYRYYFSNLAPLENPPKHTPGHVNAIFENVTFFCHTRLPILIAPPPEVVPT
jgi:hypothetical protein